MLKRIFQFLINDQPDTVVCPILPFPSTRPRLSDELIEEYAEELQAAWSVASELESESVEFFTMFGSNPHAFIVSQ